MIRLATPAPAAAKNWAALSGALHRADPDRGGSPLLAGAARRTRTRRASYGVPAWLVVGIIGVEDLLRPPCRQLPGARRARDAEPGLPRHPPARGRTPGLFPQRARDPATARASKASPRQLARQLCRRWGCRSSCPAAGCRHAVDFDGDGRIDLRGSAADAIGSVANYLRQHGWQSGMPTHYPVSLEASGRAWPPCWRPTSGQLRRGPLPGAGRAAGRAGPAACGPLALVELRKRRPAAGRQQSQAVAGTENFYVVTRYNWSSYYALAVIELGQAVQRRCRLRLPGLGPQHRQRAATRTLAPRSGQAGNRSRG